MIRRESCPKPRMAFPAWGANCAEIPVAIPGAGGAVGSCWPCCGLGAGWGLWCCTPKEASHGNGVCGSLEGCGHGTSAVCWGGGAGGTARPQAGRKTSHSKAVARKCDPVIKFTYITTFWVANCFQSGRLSPNLPLATAHPSPFQIALEDEGFFAAMRDRVKEQ